MKILQVAKDSRATITFQQQGKFGSQVAIGMQVEMYADPGARGGVLEPEGIVEIKYRTPDLIKTMHRLDPVILKIKTENGPGMEAAIRQREATLLPVYRQVSLLPYVHTKVDIAHL